MKERFLVNANYFDDKHRRPFKRYLICLMEYLRNPKARDAKRNFVKKRTAAEGLRSLYGACRLFECDKDIVRINACIDRLRAGHREEWARLLCNTHIADLYDRARRDFFAELKAMSPFADKKIRYVECQFGYMFAKGEEIDQTSYAKEGGLAWKHRKKQGGLIESFCILFPESGEGEPDVIPLEQDFDS